MLKIIRGANADKLEYLRDNDIKVVNATTGETVCTVPVQRFLEQTDFLLNKLHEKKKEKTKGAFEIKESCDFAESIQCSTLKAKSSDKSDIVLMVHDIMSGRDDTFGFSIKSQLGSPSTLLNASRSTNFTFKLVGNKVSDSEIEKFHEFKKFSDKFDYLKTLGTDIEYIETDNKTLEFNLKMVTSEMPVIFAELMKNYYQGKANMLAELIEIISDTGVVDTLDNKTYLEHNIKDMLTNIALGMVPNTLWTGNYEATGGYIIVKDDGDVVCYHIYNRNAFRNYMLKNTRFDTPSKSKHGFGSIYEVDGEQYIKLNVQIRFVK